MRMPIAVASFAALLAGMIVASGAAAAPVPFVEARAILSSPGFAEGLGTATNSDLNQTDGSASAFVNIVGASITLPGEAGEAAASASFGTLRARGEAKDPPGIPRWNTTATGQAYYRDVFTVMGGVVGTLGTFGLALRVTGHGLASHDGGLDAGIRLVRVTTNPSSFYGLPDVLTNEIDANPGVFGVSVPDAEIITTAVSFIYGTPIELEVFLQATADTNTGDSIFGLPAGLEERSVMDYSDTLLSSFILDDDDTMSAQSGTQYRLGPFATASAPATIALVGIGLAALGALRRRSR